MENKCADCGTLEAAKKERFCNFDLTCIFYRPLEGEGELETITRVRKRQECYECGQPAMYRITFLLENARINPASSGYGKDDISWCSDEDRYACEDCKDKVWRNPPRGYSWCSMFPLEQFPHMGLYWHEIKS